MTHASGLKSVVLILFPLIVCPVFLGGLKAVREWIGMLLAHSSSVQLCILDTMAGCDVTQFLSGIWVAVVIIYPEESIKSLVSYKTSEEKSKGQMVYLIHI